MGLMNLRFDEAIKKKSGAQANFAAGNTYMDALMHHHIAAGQKGMSID